MEAQKLPAGVTRLFTSWRARAAVGATIVVLAMLGFAGGGSETPVSPVTLADEVLPPPNTVVVRPDVGALPTTTTSQADAELEPLDPDPYFVSPSLGRDDNDGRTPDSPWSSLKVALTRLQPGNTLYLMDGNYSETASDNFHYIAKASGTPEAWIRITAAPGNQPVLLANVGTALEVQGNFIEVSGLTVTGEGFDESRSFGVGLSVRRSHHVRVANNVISGMPLAGISAIESSNLEVLNNEVFENAFWSTAQGSGISIWHSIDWGQSPAPDGYHDRIVGNRIYRNENRVKSKWENFATITDGNGIIIDQNRDFNYTGRTLIANNLVFDNGGRAILVFESNRVDVLFNTTYRNGRTEGLQGGPVELAAGRADDVRFINNLAWALPAAPALVANSSSQVHAEGNVLVTTDPSGHVDHSTNLVLTVDPGVVHASIDETLADFRPEPTGVLAGRAVPSKPALPYDADGIVRDPNSAAVGAYELFIG